MDMIAHLLSSMGLSKNRTLRIRIRIETRKCDRTKLKGDRPTGNFEVLGIEYCERELTDVVRMPTLTYTVA